MDKLPPPAKALLNPETYSHKTGKIELVQTQMSFVFLGDEFVYKMKKPVNLGYLDYSTLAKRLYFCQKEVELNRRLCPDVYLSVVSVTREGETFKLDGEGEVVEYAVKMRRLPQNKMMDYLLKENSVSTEMIDSLSAEVSRFHRIAATDDKISVFGALNTIIENSEENFSQARPYISKTISPQRYEAICIYARDFIKDNETLFNSRVKQGFIKDLHGDLHTAHICFTDKLCIYDCIEFNDRFRYGDTASEISFLAMDLDHYGRADLSRRFVDSYIKTSGDKNLAKLLNFYKSYRAYIRAKVANFKLDDPYIDDKERSAAADTARNYFYLSHAYTRSKTALFITVGLAGSGKSTLAQALAGKLALTVLSSDVTRKHLAGIPVTEPRLSNLNEDIYTPEFTERTYSALLEEAGEILKKGDSVIIDATFSQECYRRKTEALALQLNSDFFIVKVELDETSTRKRLEKRQGIKTASDGRWEIYKAQLNTFTPLKNDKAHNCVIIDNRQPITNNVNLIVDKLILT
jgi:aminoglycoside phosphotransferase family enzyme/predicted kinase